MVQCKQWQKCRMNYLGEKMSREPSVRITLTMLYDKVERFEEKFEQKFDEYIAEHQKEHEKLNELIAKMDTKVENNKGIAEMARMVALGAIAVVSMLGVWLWDLARAKAPVAFTLFLDFIFKK